MTMLPHHISSGKRYHLVLSAVHMVYRLVNSTYTVKELTLRLTRLLCQFIKASSVSVYLVHPSKKNVVSLASFDNQINIWRDRPQDLKDVGEDVLAVTRGASVLKDHCIGLPLVADDYLGAIFVRRSATGDPFNDFDYEMLSVFAEQVVTAMKNLQLHQEHEKIILGVISSMGNLLKKQPLSGLTHPPAYIECVKMLGAYLKLSTDGIRQLEYASLLHDIGSIDLPHGMLSKPGQLSGRELELLRRHTMHSVDLIAPVEFLKPVVPVILHHHEKYDGSGYPSGLKKEQIPLGARIIACVDAFEAMVRGRPYRPSLSVDAALDELVKYRGSQFDPRIVDAFINLSYQKKFRKLLFLLKA
ncbi:MAG: HD domain-containing protein [Candidatus Omnitrophica bacterium]|nr:HD domain-containing protein [Candidatus Omnitrophota bacterium]MDE2010212.1 HD domain-containing protein [Candidatus Omnitrophota bacterium]MDE2231706.1 HD domain-containing protein [Candidatus Omnitrophota bacterium]